MNSTPDVVPSSRKPRISYFLATACGLGYLKPGPGTWGSVAGVAISIALSSGIKTWRIYSGGWGDGWHASPWIMNLRPNMWAYVVMLVVSAVGVVVAGNVERHAGKTDPQFVVIDEVSGQLIALSFPFTLLNWKSWLLGFILFRVFDIWKPFPARQAESLHGGWGIMADDWIAGIYAGLVLWGVQATGLLK